jgi:hypothetical protein
MTTFAVVAKDRHGFGHPAKRYDITADTKAEARRQAAYEYGKLTGLSDSAIATTVQGEVRLDTE